MLQAINLYKNVTFKILKICQVKAKISNLTIKKKNNTISSIKLSTKTIAETVFFLTSCILYLFVFKKKIINNHHVLDN